jgi:hypothetical protein
MFSALFVTMNECEERRISPGQKNICVYSCIFVVLIFPVRDY